MTWGAVTFPAFPFAFHKKGLTLLADKKETD